MQLVPRDAHDDVLVAHAHPPDWTNPTPAGRYNLVAIGGGTAGLVAAVAAASLRRQGGAGRAPVAGGRLPEPRLRAQQGAVAFGRCRARAGARRRVGISRHDPRRLGFRGRDGVACAACGQRSARTTRPSGCKAWAWTFISARRASPAQRPWRSAGQTLEFRRAVIATGTRPAAPPVEGLAELGYLDQRDDILADRTAAAADRAGCGPRSVASWRRRFARLGSEVHLINDTGSLAGQRGSPTVQRLIAARLEAEGIHLHLGWQSIRRPTAGQCQGPADRAGQRAAAAHRRRDSGGRRPRGPTSSRWSCRRPASSRIARGVVVERLFCRRPTGAIYAAGDVCTMVRHTHAAHAMARVGHPQRAVSRAREVQPVGDSTHHVHRSRDRARGPDRSRSRATRHPARQLPCRDGRRRPGRGRQPQRRICRRARASRERATIAGAHDRLEAAPAR